MVNTEISFLIPVGLFILSFFVGLIGFFLRQNWQEIKETNNKILSKVESLNDGFIEMKTDHKSVRRDLEFLEKNYDKIETELHALRSSIDLINNRLNKIEIIRDNIK